MLDKSLTLHIADGETNLTPDPSHPLRFEKEVAYVADFKKWRSDGTLDMHFEVEESDIDNWIEQHNQQIAAGLEVAMPVEHTTDPLRKGATALQLVKKPDSKGRTALFVLGEFVNEDRKKDLSKTQVSLFSPPEYKHGDHVFRRPIRHIAFTDNPVIGDLDKLRTIAASCIQEKDMHLRKLAESFGLTLSADQTDEQIAAAIEAHVNAKPKVIAASVETTLTDDKPDPVVLSLSRDNRRMKIQQLVALRKATPAEAQNLEKRWAGETLSLSTESISAFDDVYASYMERETIRELSGEVKTPAQKYDKETNSLARAADKINSRS
jgi:hypothetical protein